MHQLLPFPCCLLWSDFSCSAYGEVLLKACWTAGRVPPDPLPLAHACWSLQGAEMPVWRLLLQPALHCLLSNIPYLSMCTTASCYSCC